MAFSYFFLPSKVWSILHHAPLGASSELNKKKLTLTLTLNLLLHSIVFHHEICVFIMIIMALSFLRFIHGQFFYEKEMFGRLYDIASLSLLKAVAILPVDKSRWLPYLLIS